jgi:hypothetical protein
MGKDSSIQWIHQKPSTEVFLSSPEISGHRDRFKVNLLMTVLADGEAVGHLESEFGVTSKRFDMMGLEIPAAIVAAMLAGVFVAGIYRIAPLPVLDLSSVATIALALAVRKRVMKLAPSGSFFRDLGNFLATLGRVRLPKPIAWTRLCGLTHLLS